MLFVLDGVDCESDAWLDPPLACDWLGDPSFCEPDDELPANLASLRRRIYKNKMNMSQELFMNSTLPMTNSRIKQQQKYTEIYKNKSKNQVIHSAFQFYQK